MGRFWAVAVVILGAVATIASACDGRQPAPIAAPTTSTAYVAAFASPDEAATAVYRAWRSEPRRLEEINQEVAQVLDGATPGDRPERCVLAAAADHRYTQRCRLTPVDYVAVWLEVDQGADGKYRVVGIAEDLPGGGTS